MAEDEDILDDLEDAEAAGKKKPWGMIIGIIIGLLVLGGGGYFAYITFFQEKPVEETPAEGKEGAPKVVKEEGNMGVMFPLDPFIVNLAGSAGKRFLKVTISLELSTPEVHAELKENIHALEISINFVAASAVPPVAIRSSINKTESPCPIASLCTSIVAVPYSNSKSME